MSAEDGEYEVVTDNGAIYLETSDLDEAIAMAALINDDPTWMSQMREAFPGYEHPGRARVYEVKALGSLVEVVR